MNMQQDESESTAELPKLFKTWKQVYTFVIIELVVCLVLFYGITKFFG